MKCFYFKYNYFIFIFLKSVRQVEYILMIIITMVANSYLFFVSICLYLIFSLCFYVDVRLIQRVSPCDYPPGVPSADRNVLNLKNNKELFIQYSYEGNDKQGAAGRY